MSSTDHSVEFKVGGDELRDETVFVKLTTISPCSVHDGYAVVQFTNDNTNKSPNFGLLLNADDALRISIELSNCVAAIRGE